MLVEHHTKPFQPHFDFTESGGDYYLLWRQTPYDGYYNSVVGATVKNNNVYLFYGPYEGHVSVYPIQVPQSHQLLGTTISYPSEGAAIHTDGQQVYATFRRLSDDHKVAKTVSLGSPATVRKFNTAVALKQRTGNWLIIPPAIETMSVHYWCDLDSTQVRDQLRSKAIFWKKDKGDPVIVKFLRRTAPETIPPVVIGIVINNRGELFTFGHKIGSPEPSEPIDLKSVFKTNDTNQLLNELSKVEPHVARHGSAIGVQLGAKILKILGTDIEELDAQNLVESTSNIFLQKGNQILALTGTARKQENFRKLAPTTSQPVLSSLRVGKVSPTENLFLLSTADGRFHISHFSDTSGEAIPQFKQMLTKQVVSIIESPTVATLDTMYRLLSRPGDLMSSLGLCST